MKDIVYVEHQHYVSVVQSSFRFVNLVSKEERFIPFDDVEWLIFDHERSYFSNRLVSLCMEKNIGVMFCDKKHSPLTCLTPDYGHSQKLARLKLQIALTKKMKNRLWRKIIIAKINNQADCIALMTTNKQTAKTIQLMGKQVTEGDKTNRESQAARVYFPTLFGTGFKRGRYDDAVNASLNYGYALLRAVIRKELIIHGFEPSLGINHESSENPFNLSDDMIESYRPFVDAYVYEMIYTDLVLSLGVEEKKKLLHIFFEKCIIEGKVCTILDAIKVTVISYKHCLEEDSSAPLKLPVFIEVGK